MATPAAAALSMKLLVDWKSRRVLLAEAGKDVVDFLFSLVALPIATAVKLVGADAVVGSVGNLYASIDKLDGTYVQAGAAKDALLSPTVLSPAASANGSLLRLPPAPAPTSWQPKTLYRCTSTYCRGYIGDVYGQACPSCNTSMTSSVQYLSTAMSDEQKAQGAAKGLVQGVVTYTVPDNCDGSAELKHLIKRNRHN